MSKTANIIDSIIDAAQELSPTKEQFITALASILARTVEDSVGESIEISSGKKDWVVSVELKNGQQ